MPGPYRRVPQELKDKILDAVKNDGIPVSQASREYGVSTPSIHSWLKKELENTSWERIDMREVNRLRKDKEDLLKLVWALTAELDKTKKKSY